MKSQNLSCEEKDVAKNYEALPDHIKEMAKAYWLGLCGGLDFRAIYDEAYMEGYEDCELKWGKMNGEQNVSD